MEGWGAVRRKNKTMPACRLPAVVTVQAGVGVRMSGGRRCAMPLTRPSLPHFRAGRTRFFRLQCGICRSWHSGRYGSVRLRCGIWLPCLLCIAQETLLLFVNFWPFSFVFSQKGVILHAFWSIGRFYIVTQINNVGSRQNHKGEH